MQTKLFEVRDAMTFIPCIAVWCSPNCEEERYLLARAGYGRAPMIQEQYVLFGEVSGHGEFISDPNRQRHGRTMEVAHQYIREHWADLRTGQVIDVQFITGETPEPKISEALE
jgi:hypothetical protein